MTTTKCVAIDCEMVGGPNGESLAARVSIVNEYGQVIMDKYIKPSKPVSDYRTFVSGITAAKLSSAESLTQVSSEVARIINGRIIVGHSLDKDLEALGLTVPENMKRDLAQYPSFKYMNKGQSPSLKLLAQRILSRSIQEGPHSSVDDAKAAMDIYQTVAREWQ